MGKSVRVRSGGLVCIRLVVLYRVKNESREKKGSKKGQCWEAEGRSGCQSGWGDG